MNSLRAFDGLIVNAITGWFLNSLPAVDNGFVTLILFLWQDYLRTIIWLCGFQRLPPSFFAAVLLCPKDIYFPIKVTQLSSHFENENFWPTSRGFGEETASSDAVVFEILFNKLEITSLVLSPIELFNKSFISVNFSQLFRRRPMSLVFFFPLK